MSLISFRCCTKFNLIQTQAEKREKKARCIAKGFIIYYLQLANLIVRLTQLLAAKIEAQIAQMPRAGKEREELGNFWLALRCRYCSGYFLNTEVMKLLNSLLAVQFGFR